MTLVAGLRLRFETAGPAGGRHRAAPARAGLLRRRRGRNITDDPLALDEVADLVGRQGLVFQEALRQRVQLVEVAGQDLASGALALIDDAANLLVDELGRGVGDVLALGDRMAEEHLFLIVGVAQGPELLAKAE